MIPEDIENVALLGWRVYPSVNAKGIRAACFKGASAAATCDLDTINDWCQKFPNCNWRVVMEGSGIWAIDCDVPSEGHEGDGITAMKSLIEKHGPLPERPMTKSGGGGIAMFFRYNGERISGKTGTPVAGIDPRRGKLSVTIPPSIHHTTRMPYRWLFTPWDVRTPDAPQWLIDSVADKTEQYEPVKQWKNFQNDKVLRTAHNKITNAVNGSRNHTLNGQAFFIGRFVSSGMIDEKHAISVLYDAAKICGLDDIEIKQTIKSAFFGARRYPITQA